VNAAGERVALRVIDVDLKLVGKCGLRTQESEEKYTEMQTVLGDTPKSK
jgi:hypothetical protein